MSVVETSCGQELANDAEVPELLAELWGLVATNMSGHAKWVGTTTAEAAAEHDALQYIAGEYRTIAAAAERAAAMMSSLGELAPARHDPALLDRAAQVSFLRHKIKLQLQLASLLESHAEASRAALVELEASLET